LKKLKVKQAINGLRPATKEAQYRVAVKVSDTTKAEYKRKVRYIKNKILFRLFRRTLEGKYHEQQI
jgi:hypothetical protein